MSMTVTEKILAHASGVKSVKAGDIVTVSPDWIMSNDATTHITIDIFNNRLKNGKVVSPEKNVWFIDHNFPCNDIKTADVHHKMKKFAAENGIKNFHNGEGVCHQLLLEKYILPGQIVIGADSHTCTLGAIGAFGTGMGSTDIAGAMATGITWLKVPESIKIYIHGKLKKGVFHRDIILYVIGRLGAEGAAYRTLEFTGPAVKAMTVPDRAVLCNMAVEAGAKNGIIAADNKCEEFLSKNDRTFKDFKIFSSDVDAQYYSELDIDLSEIAPGVALPHNVDNYSTADLVEKEKIKVDQGFIGACSNGRIENLREAAEILQGRTVKEGVKLIISPASRSVYMQALKEGLIETFISSGAVVLNPSCSACWGGCQGVITKNEVSISTGTRNFKGRTGHADSKIYLASAATVAASCIAGMIVNPENFL